MRQACCYDSVVMHGQLLVLIMQIQARDGNSALLGPAANAKLRTVAASALQDAQGVMPHPRKSAGEPPPAHDHIIKQTHASTVPGRSHEATSHHACHARRRRM